MVHGSQNRGSWTSWGPTIIFSEKKSPYLNNLSLDHGSSSGVIDETLVTTIMAQIPNISNFKENRQFDAFNMECMAWSAHNFQMSNCNLFES